jgi:hypothetical protein
MAYVEKFKAYFSPRLLGGKLRNGINKYGKGTLDASGITFDGLTGPAAARGFYSQSSLQEDIPGIVSGLSTPLRIDLLTGITVAGTWATEELRVKGEEYTGQAEFYTDHGNIPLVGVSALEEKRDVVRFEQGLSVGLLQEEQDGMDQRDALNSNRNAQIESLNRSREQVAIFGVANARTYGLLNDPNLSPYVANTTPWIGATYEDLVNEFATMIAALEQQIGYVDESWDMTLVLPADAVGAYRVAIHVTQSGSGKMFKEYLKEAYPNLKIEFLRELEGASGGTDGAYLIVETSPYNENITVQGGTLTQIVPARYRVLGSERRIKEYIEDAVTASAGTMVFKPYCVTRRELA